MKLYLRLIALILFVACSINNTNADTQTKKLPSDDQAIPEPEIYTAVTTVNIRKGPATEFETAGMLSKGAYVKAETIQDQWIKIDENKWVFSAFLEEQ